MGDAPPTLSGRILAVSAGRAGTITGIGMSVETAFVKQEIPARVHVGSLGIVGDEHVYDDHGGPDMALLAYPVEHYAHWRGLGIDLPSVAAMAENLTVSGLLETEVCIGDIFTAGSATLQVTQPRSPCYKIAARYGRKDLALLVQETGFIGFLLRVVEEGEIGAGDEIRLIERDRHGISVAFAGRIANVERNDIDGARRVLAVDALGSSVRRKLEQRVASHERVGLDTARLYDEPI